jgi:hypothetical protein
MSTFKDSLKDLAVLAVCIVGLSGSVALGIWLTGPDNPPDFHFAAGQYYRNPVAANLDPFNEDKKILVLETRRRADGRQYVKFIHVGGPLDGQVWTESAWRLTTQNYQRINPPTQ